MCFVWIWEQTAIISLYSINWLAFITDTENVYCAVGAEYLYVTDDPPDGTPTNICATPVMSDVTHCLRGRFMESDGWICDEVLCDRSCRETHWNAAVKMTIACSCETSVPVQRSALCCTQNNVTVFACAQQWEALCRILRLCLTALLLITKYSMFRWPCIVINSHNKSD